MAFKDEEDGVVKRFEAFANGEDGIFTRSDAWFLLGTLDRALKAERDGKQIKYEIQELARDAGVDLEKH